jgi:hypothetical protein
MRMALLRLSAFVQERDEKGLRNFLNDLLPEAHLNGRAQTLDAQMAATAK